MDKASDKIRLVLADVDGTLVGPEKELTERAIKSVQALKDAGVIFAITSGRPPRGMAMLIEPLEITDPIAGFNGGAFADAKLKLIERHTVSAEDAKKAVDAMDANGLDPWLYSGENWYVRKLKAPHVDREQWTVKFEPKVTDDFTELYGDAIKITGVSDDHDKVAAAEKAAKEAIGKRATIARSQPYYLDVTSTEANKGAVVAWLAKHYKIEPHEIATLGDMPNDIDMFKKSGLAIAMGQSDDEVKGQAHFTTDSNKEDGFAKAIEKYVLPRAAGKH